MLGKNLLLALAGKGAAFTFELTHSNEGGVPCSVWNHRGEHEKLPLQSGVYVMPQIASFRTNREYRVEETVNLTHVEATEYVPSEEEEDSYVRVAPTSGGGVN